MRWTNKKMDQVAQAKSAGFTLLELMIAVLIVALLASIALPAYDEFSQKSRRTEGLNALLQVAALQERWFTENGTYTANLTELGLAAAGTNQTDGGYYDFGLVAPTGGCAIADCFVLEAKPAPGSAQADDEFWFRIASDGLREIYDTDAGSWSRGWEQ